MTAAGAGPLTIYYIRHGETAWSITGQHTGVTDIPLTANGEAAARGLGPRLRGIAFSHVLVSPLQRARRTCDLAGFGASAQIEPDLVESNYGDYEGRLSADIEKERPGWSLFRDGCPNGDSPARISDRADRLIGRLVELRGNVALFSHGHFGAAFAARWLELPLFEGRRFPLDPCSISLLGFAAHHPADRVIHLWNAVDRFQAS
jgi:probable phosphoglycerate mutase